jgi:RNA polymerase sigma-70 factor (ECF subfamily)
MPAEKYSEERLIELLMQKDKSAFSYLYDKYSGALYGIVLKILNRDEENSQDILQEVFLKIWKNMDKYDSSKGTLFTWMLNIARYTAIDKLRSNKNKSIQSIENNVHNVDAQYKNEMGEDTIGVKEVVSNLKQEYKILIDLAYYNGYTQEEISEKLKMPLGTVKTRTRAALIELRKRML